MVVFYILEALHFLYGNILYVIEKHSVLRFLIIWANFRLFGNNEFLFVVENKVIMFTSMKKGIVLDYYLTIILGRSVWVILYYTSEPGKFCSI